MQQQSENFCILVEELATALQSQPSPTLGLTGQCSFPLVQAKENISKEITLPQSIMHLYLSVSLAL